MKTLLLSIFLAILISGYVSWPAREELDPPNPTEPPPPSESIEGYYYDAAVASNCPPCAVYGRDVLMEGGNAVDAAIAVLLCEGISCIHSMGAGGGHFMTIYDRETQQVFALNSREVAPGAAYEDMFNGDPELSSKGGLAVAVPGELKGFWAAHQRFGKLPWARILQPTIDLCEIGSLVTETIADVLVEKEEDIRESPTLSEILINQTTGELLKEGDRILRPGYAETLRVIQTEGADAIYTGSLAQGFVDDMEELGCIITLEDLANYQPRWEDPISIPLSNGLTAYTLSSPSSGPLVALILNVLDGFIPGPDPSITHHRIVETFKWAFGQRTRMGDPYYVDIADLLTNLTSKDFAMLVRSQIDDTQTYYDPAFYGGRTAETNNHGTAHTSVLAPDGSAVAATSTINAYFGAKIRSRSVDIILNNLMDDFSSPNITNIFGVPPSVENFIVPGKRPLSAMSPTIFVDSNGDVRLIVGGAGGTRITTSVTSVMIRHLFFNETIKEAIDAPRWHHQLYPMLAKYEMGVTQDIVAGIEAIGHETERNSVGGSSVNAIARHATHIAANSDFRRNGYTIAGF